MSLMIVAKCLVVLFVLAVVASCTGCPRPGFPSDRTCYYRFTVVNIPSSNRVQGVVPRKVVENAAKESENPADYEHYPFEHVYTFNVTTTKNLKREGTYTFRSMPTDEFGKPLEPLETHMREK